MENGSTKNFTVDEFKCKCCGVDGVKPAAKEAIQQVRDLYGKPMRLNSAYRCEKHNKAVGGHPNSEHLSGIAFDVHAATAEDRYRLVEMALACGFKGIGVYAGGWVHMDYRLGKKSLWVG